MAQLAGAMPKSVVAVPLVEWSAGASLAFSACALMAQASVPPPIVPAVRMGVPMATGVAEPSASSSSVKVKASWWKDGPRAACAPASSARPNSAGASSTVRASSAKTMRFISNFP